MSGVAPESTGKPSYRPDIDGLRALAVLLVVAYHFGFGGFHGGFIGVDVFYVISGFLITQQLAREIARRGRLDVLGFYARRMRRLLPAAAVTLVATTAVAAAVLPPLRARDVARDGAAAALYSTNWWFAAQRTNYLASDRPPSPLLHFWSLSVEEQFYLVWPALILVAAMLGRRRTRAAILRRVALAVSLVLVLSLAASVALSATTGPWAFYGLHTRAWELAVGGLIGLAALRAGARRAPDDEEPVPRRPLALARAALAWAGVAALVAGVLKIRETTPYPGVAAVLPVLGAALLIATGSGGQRGVPLPHRVLSLPAARWLGQRSYSLYLWHWPVAVLGPWMLPLPGLPRTLVLLGVSVALAHLSYRHIEQPVRAHRRLARLRVGVVSLGAATTVGLVGVTSALATGVDARQNAQAARAGITPSPVDARNDKSRVYADNCMLSAQATRSGDCVYGDPSGTSTMVLYGDSHAAQWFPAIDALAKQRHEKLLVLTKSGCPGVDVTMYRPDWKRSYTECGAWRDDSVARIKATPNVSAIISTALTGTPVMDSRGSHVLPDPQVPAAWGAGAAGALRELAPLARQVIFLRDNPQPGFDAAVCVSAHMSNPGACSFDRARPLDARIQSAITRAARAYRNARVVDASTLICPDQTCQVVEHGILKFFDRSHMTATYVRSLTPSLGRLLALPTAPAGADAGGVVTSRSGGGSAR